MFEALKELLENAAYNRKLYRDGKANKNEVRLTTIGWRASEEQIETDGKKSPSGEYEYHQIIRDQKGRH